MKIALNKTNRVFIGRTPENEEVKLKPGVPTRCELDTKNPVIKAMIDNGQIDYGGEPITDDDADEAKRQADELKAKEEAARKADELKAKEEGQGQKSETEKPAAKPVEKAKADEEKPAPAAKPAKADAKE